MHYELIKKKVADFTNKAGICYPDCYRSKDDLS